MNMTSGSELFDTLLHVHTETDWLNTCITISQQLGFPYFLFGYLPHKLTPLTDAKVLGNMPQAWLQTYLTEQCKETDPVLQHCARHQRPFFWAEEYFADIQAQATYACAAGYDLKYGLALPGRGQDAEVSIMLLLSPDPARHPAKLGAQQIGQLCLFRDFAMDALRPLLLPPETAPVKLTPREIECLIWAARGKSSWEIAQILSCAETTVNFHINNAKQKFGVTSRQQAVILAIRGGWIAIN